mmetsp:Transcript_70184/g.165117  ORF Transcript_70184/g.165117 Transcript_70184/m.165117 type:complete len:204 (+) Transcript_70184:32-643(+)
MASEVGVSDEVFLGTVTHEGFTRTVAIERSGDIATAMITRDVHPGPWREEGGAVQVGDFKFRLDPDSGKYTGDHEFEVVRISRDTTPALLIGTVTHDDGYVADSLFVIEIVSEDQARLSWTWDYTAGATEPCVAILDDFRIVEWTDSHLRLEAHQHYYYRWECNLEAGTFSGQWYNKRDEVVGSFEVTQRWKGSLGGLVKAAH